MIFKTRKITYSLLLFSIFLLSFSASALPDNLEEIPWKTWQENASQKVQYRSINNSNLIEIKGKTTLKSSLSAFLLFIQDVDNVNNWLDSTRKAKVISQISKSESIFTVYFDNVWPVKTRQIVMHSKFWQKPNRSIKIQLSDASDKVSDNKSVIKIALHSAEWLIIPKANNYITIEYTFIADPKGSIPKWLVHRLSLKSIWKTLKNLQQQLPSSPWQKLHIEGIVEM